MWKVQGKLRSNLKLMHLTKGGYFICIFQPECYYRGFRDDSGTFTPVHWKILALKFAFVIIFEHLVFGVCKLIDILVPDIPESLDIKVKRERYLAKEALQDAEHVLQKVYADQEEEGKREEVA